MDANELAQRYKKAVEEKLGLLGKIDDAGDVIFRHPDLGSFFFSLDAKDDPEYMMLVFPNFADKDLTGGDRGKLLELVNQVNRTNKAVKLAVRDNPEASVGATDECFLGASGEMPSQDLLNGVIKRNLSAIRSAVQSLIQAAKGGGAADQQTSI